MIPCAWGIARLSLFPRKSLQEGPMSCLLMLVFCTAEAHKDWFAQGNKHVFLGVWWLLASSNKNCLIQDFLNWQNRSGLWEECKDVPSYFKASFSLCRGISLLMLELKEWGVERSLNKVLPLGSFQSRNFFFIRSTNTWKHIFIMIGYLGLVWTVIIISHIISVASPFVLISFLLFFFLWPPCFHLFASQKTEGPKYCTLMFFHYSQKVSRSLIIMQIGNDLYLENTRHFI